MQESKKIIYINHIAIYQIFHLRVTVPFCKAGFIYEKVLAHMDR